MSTEQLANWMIANGFATGHGDDVEGLLSELSLDMRELRAKVTRRGARLQVMREWLESRNQMGTNNDWTEFCRERPAAAQWFDEDGVPK